MKDHYPLSQRASVALDRFLCSSAADPRTARALDRLADDVQAVDGDGADYVPVGMRPQFPSVLERRQPSEDEEQDAERFDGLG